MTKAKPSKVTKIIQASTKALMDDLHASQERIADKVATIVDAYWQRLAIAIAEKIDPDQLIIASNLAHKQMVRDLKASYTKEIDGLLTYTHQRAVDNVLIALPESWVEELLAKALPAAKLPTGAAAQKKSLRTAIFSSKQVDPGQIVASLISDTTHLGNPQDITNTVNLMRLAGKTSRQIATAIKPQVYGIKSTVRRVVRDSSQFAATAENLSTWNAMGSDFIIGYEVHAVPRTKYSRIDHLKRSGTIYYVNPQKGQKGLQDMPQPPYDVENGRMVLKHNCRCFISPVFAEQYQVVKKVA